LSDQLKECDKLGKTLEEELIKCGVTSILTQIKTKIGKFDAWSLTEPKNATAWTRNELASLIYYVLNFGGSDLRDISLEDPENCLKKRTTAEV
jgi:hypothetical protein